MKLQFTVSPAIAGKFRIVKTVQPIYHSKIGRFDFRTITEQDAQRLVDIKSIYIKKLKPTQQ